MYSIFVNNADKALLGQWPEAILIFKSPRQGGATASKQASNFACNCARSVCQ